MKKIFFLILLLLAQINLQAFSAENVRVLNMHANESYVLDYNARPMEIQNSNTEAVRVERITAIMTEDSSLLITTYREGIVHISFLLNGKEMKLKLLIDNQSPEDEDLVKIDKPKKENK